VLSSIPHIGKPDHFFDPWHYTAFEPHDHYTKKTGLWIGNGFVMPPKAVAPELAGIKPDNRIHFASPGDERAAFRSATPMGFARAVFQANNPVSLSAGRGSHEVGLASIDSSLSISPINDRAPRAEAGRTADVPRSQPFSFLSQDKTGV
jgi:hypothetical protein